MCTQHGLKAGLDETVSVVAALLESVVVAGAGKATEVSVYDAQEVPAISVEGYLVRWFDHVDCTVEVLVAAVMYIDRLAIELTATNVHRLLLAALVVATKYLNDKVHPNPHFAAVGGVTAMELSRLESTFLNDIEWTTFIEPKVFAKYSKQLRKAPLKLRLA